jgi:hypothetical protein
LASIFAVRIGIPQVNFLSFLNLRVFSVGFDFRVFHAEPTLASVMDCHRPSITKQEDEPRRAGTTVRVTRKDQRILSHGSNPDETRIGEIKRGQDQVAHWLLSLPATLS